MRRPFRKPTPAQHQASMENLTFKQMSGLRKVFRDLGHYEFEQKVSQLADSFRDKLKRTPTK